MHRMATRHLQRRIYMNIFQERKIEQKESQLWKE